MPPRAESVSVHQRLRPLRIGFLVDPNDTTSIDMAIKTNTGLWGGMFNPLIPVVRRAPAWAWEDSRKRPTPSMITDAYVKAFEPDVLVDLVGKLKDDLNIDRSRLVPLEAIGLGPNSVHSVGLSVHELYKDLPHQSPGSLAGNRVMPVADSPQLELFVSAYFGSFASDAIGTELSMSYQHHLGGRYAAIGLGSVFSWALSRFDHPLNTGRTAIKVEWTHYTAGTIMLLLDPTQPIDVLGFWNLRALGRQVLPVPMGSADGTLAECARLIRNPTDIVPADGRPAASVRLIKAHSVPSREFGFFLEAVEERLGEHVFGKSYPHYWDPDAPLAGFYRHDISAGRATAVCRVEGGRTSIPTIHPPFIQAETVTSGAQWVNVVELSSTELNSELTTVFPYDMRDMGELFRSTTMERVFGASREGIIVGVERLDETLHWCLPDGLTVFKAWLAQKGFKADLSPAGRITTQLLKAIGGLPSIAAFANRGMLQLLDGMAHGTVEIPTTDEWAGSRKSTTRARIIGRDKLLGELRRIYDGDGERADLQLSFLIQRAILRLGLRIQCPECGQWTWYSLQDVGDRLRCERCLSDYAFPAIDPPKDIWYYRTQGPFSVENYAQGGYATALALRCLHNFSYGGTTWVPSILGPNLEADFAMLWQQTSGGPSPKLVWGECKTFNKFEGKDVTRARRLIDQFPGSVFVFATLRESLTQGEKRRIRALARYGRKQWGFQWCKGPIMVLTARELLAAEHVPKCWQGAGGKCEVIFTRLQSSPHDLLALCDATQELYLDMGAITQTSLSLQ